MLIVVALASVAAAWAQDNDKILNRQYADMKRLHFGFSVGMNLQDLHIKNNGFITADGEQWWADVPSHSPGFARYCKTAQSMLSAVEPFKQFYHKYYTNHQ